jgi:hypothetical protein
VYSVYRAPPPPRSLRLFQRKPIEAQEWQQKLPDFLLRLEEAMYRGARTKVRCPHPRTLRTPAAEPDRMIIHWVGFQARPHLYHTF